MRWSRFSGPLGSACQKNAQQLCADLWTRTCLQYALFTTRKRSTTHRSETGLPFCNRLIVGSKAMSSRVENGASLFRSQLILCWQSTAMFRLKFTLRREQRGVRHDHSFSLEIVTVSNIMFPLGSLTCREMSFTGSA